MSDGAMAYADLIILALIAGFVLLRLRSVLGQKIGHDNPPGYKEYQSENGDDPAIIQANERQKKAKDLEKEEEKQLAKEAVKDDAYDGIEEIRKLDPQFSLKHFLEGARGAFEMVFDAFTKEDRETLKMLLAPELKELFYKEIDKKNSDESYVETTLLAVESTEVVKAHLYRNVAQVTVRFVSEQVTLKRDKAGEIIEGDPTHSEHVEDEWTFERDIASRNPNWQIIDT